MAALATLVVALARPQSAEQNTRTNTDGIDIMLALDVSGSMLARDFRPDRLEAAKEVAGSFISDRYGDRIGLVVFAGEAFTQSPLTADQSTLLTLLGRVRSGLIEDGTAIGNGLATAINRLRESDAKSKVIILLTDGVNNRGEIAPVMAAEIAKEQGIRVYTIGVGSRGTAPTPAIDMFGNMTFVQAKVEIDEKTLQEIADATGGATSAPRTTRSCARSTTRSTASKEQSRGSRLHDLHRRVPAVGIGGAGAARRGISDSHPDS